MAYRLWEELIRLIEATQTNDETKNTYRRDASTVLAGILKRMSEEEILAMLQEEGYKLDKGQLRDAIRRLKDAASRHPGKPRSRNA